MPEDVPLAGSAGRVTTPHTGTWDVSERFWELYFGVVATAVGVLLLVIPDADHLGPNRWIGFGLLGAMVLWYALVGHRVIAEADESWRGRLFQAGQLALFVAAVAWVDLLSLLLFALCPMAYMTVRLMRAHLVVVVYAFTPAAVAAIESGLAAMLFTVPIGVIATTISVVTAVTTVRTERISRERAALIQELEASRAEVARLSHDAGIAAERQRLAGEIHDTVAQGLSSVVMLVEAADAALDRDLAVARDHLRLAARAARENLAEARAIVGALTPAPLDGTPLADALRRVVDRFTDETGIAAALSTVGDPRPLPTGTEVVLLRVVQEALHNVRKHAGASKVAVELSSTDEAVRVEVSDDGVGFDGQPLSQGYGLGGMRSRVEQVGGALTISSAPGQGTTIRTEVPA